MEKFQENRKQHLTLQFPQEDPNQRLSQTIIYPLLRKGRYTAAEAVLQRHPELVDEKGKLQNEFLANKYGSMKPLHMCATYGNKEGLELLIKYGADVTELTGNGRSSVVNLICAAQAITSEEMVKCLDVVFKQSTRHVNFKDDKGFTPLLRAAVKCDGNMINRLLKAGADPSIVHDRSGASPIWYIMAAGFKGHEFSPALPLLFANVPESTMKATSTGRARPKHFVIASHKTLSPQMISVYKRDMASIRAFVEAGWFIQKTRYEERSFYEKCYTGSIGQLYDELCGKSKKDKIEEQFVSVVPTLQWWSKRAIRRSLPIHPHLVIDALPVPEKLRRYVLSVDCLPQDKEEELKSYSWSINKPSKNTARRRYDSSSSESEYYDSADELVNYIDYTSGSGEE